MYTLIGYNNRLDCWYVLDTFETLIEADDYLLSPMIDNDKRLYYSQFMVCEHQRPLIEMCDVNEMIMFDNGRLAQWDSGKHKGYQKGSFLR